MRNAHDPPVARILWGLIAVAAVGALLSLPFDYSLANLVPLLGGVIVILGSYFAARTLRENEVNQATLMLAGANEAVRAAGVHRLATVASETPRFRPYVTVALQAFAAETANGDRPRKLATAVLEELSTLDKRQIVRLDLRALPD